MELQGIVAEEGREQRVEEVPVQQEVRIPVQIPKPPKPPPRRSGRERKKPKWHDTYHVGQSQLMEQKQQDVTSNSTNKTLHSQEAEHSKIGN